MDELVFKPTDGSGGKGVFIGPSTAADELAGLADVIRRSPDKWIAQEVVHLSTVPTAGDDGVLAPRHVDLRPFAVFGETISIVPGGLSRVALTEGSMIVNSSRGGGSKDTWVLESGDDHTDRVARAAPREPASGAPRPALRRLDRPGPAATAAAVLARIAQELFWLGRNLARAEHTSRLLDGVFQADLQGRPEGWPRRRRCRGSRSCTSWAAGATARSPTTATPCSTRSPATPTTRPRSSRAWRGRARARRPCATSSPPRCGRRSTRRTCACATATSRPARRRARTASTSTSRSARRCSGA